MLMGGPGHHPTSWPPSSSASKVDEASREFEFQILSSPVVPPERIDPMLDLTDIRDHRPPSSWGPSSQGAIPFEPELELQSEEKQSSWAAEVVADEHALSARCADPPVGHGRKATVGTNESVTAHVTPEVATPGDGSSSFGPRPMTMPAQVISVAFGPMSHRPWIEAISWTTSMGPKRSCLLSVLL